MRLILTILFLFSIAQAQEVRGVKIEIATYHGGPTYENTEQSFTAYCPPGYSGDPVEISIPAGFYTSYDQDVADNLARQKAEDSATALLDCTPVSEVDLSSYPAMVVTGPTGVSPPGDAFFFNAASLIPSNTPTLAEWTRQAGPDQHIAITGDKLNTGGVQAYDVYRNGLAVQSATLSTSQQSDRGAVLLPSSLSTWDFYVLWPRNGNGRGKPVAINRAETFWMQRTAMSGETKVRIFGRNLARNNTPGTNNSYIYIQHTNGSGGGYATVTNVTPYEVQFTLPTLTTGTYNVWVHNGHGGQYGWSEPLVMTVASSTVKGRAALTNAGTPASATFTAINTLATSAGQNRRITLSATTYTGSSQLTPLDNTEWVGQVDGSGNPTTILSLSGSISSTGNTSGLLSRRNITGFKLENVIIRLNGFSPGHSAIFAFLSTGNNYFKNVRIESPYRNPIDLRSCVGNFFTNVWATGGAGEWDKLLYMEYCSQIFVDSCRFYGTKDAEGALGGKGIDEFSLTNSHIQDYNNASVDGWLKGRIFSTIGNGGAQTNLYFAGNVGTGLGVRYKATNPSHNAQTNPDNNSGEIFLWEATKVLKEGFVVSATATTVTFGSTVSQYVENLGNRKQSITIAYGKGLWQTRRILSGYGTNTITVDKPFNVIPDATSYALIGTWTSQVVVYNNSLDANGKSYIASDGQQNGSASAGVESYSGSMDITVDYLYTNGIRDVVINQSLQNVQNGAVSPNYFGLYQNIFGTGPRFGITTRAYPEPASDTYSGQLPQTGIAAAVYRNVTITSPYTYNTAWYIPFTAQANGRYVADLIIHENFRTTPVVNAANMLNYARWEFVQPGIPAAKASGLVNNEVHYKNQLNAAP